MPAASIKPQRRISFGQHRSGRSDVGSMPVSSWRVTRLRVGVLVWEPDTELWEAWLWISQGFGMIRLGD